LKRNYFQYLFALLLLLLFVNVAFAKHKVTTNSMGYFQTNNVYPLDKGQLEVLFLPAYFHNRDFYQTVLPVEFDYGLTDKWFVLINFETFSILSPIAMPTVSGIGELTLATEYSIMHICGTENHIAFVMSIRIPTADINHDLTDGLLRFLPAFLFAHDTEFKTFYGQIFGEIALSLVDRIKHHRDPVDDAPAAHAVLISIGYDIRTPQVNYSVEINWSNNQWNNGGTNNSLYITPGIFYLTKVGAEFGIGIAIGLTHHSDCFRILGEANYTFSLID